MSTAESTTDIAAKPPIWFWVVAIVALLWNLIGLAAFAASLLLPIEDMTPDPAFQDVLRKMPAWYYAAFGTGVVAGSLGCVGLLMRAKWAFPVFIVSLVGILAQQFYMYFMSDAIKVQGIGSVVFPTIVLVIAILLILFARSSTTKGWLK